MIDTARNAAPRWIGLGIALGMHAAAVALLLDHRPAGVPALAPAPIFVRFIAPAAAPAEPKPIVKPEPKRLPTPVAKPLPRPTATPVPKPAPRPTPKSTTAPAPAEQAVEARPAPAAASAAAPPPARAGASEALAAAPSTSPDAPIMQPRFDADYLRNPPPAYPRLARRLGEEGLVVLRVLVGPDGRPERVELRASSGSQRLDRAALDTVRGWTFVPARRSGAPVPAWVLVPMRFTLEG